MIFTLTYMKLPDMVQEKHDEGVNADSLGADYSTIEEARADLVALYFMADDKLKEFGIYDDNIDVKEATLAQYVGNITNGAVANLEGWNQAMILRKLILEIDN